MYCTFIETLLGRIDDHQGIKGLPRVNSVRCLDIVVMRLNE